MRGERLGSLQGLLGTTWWESELELELSVPTPNPTQASPKPLLSHTGEYDYGSARGT